ncbi:hypothetical protein Prudu_001681 [Prunus dulcis]|uniref:Uncharacterized protein n=1 Tax=Prunus dulcis TaxID=3755 RepID=A0A4Y1QP51_PRUDU|nr:hypothetical protein Prudu_001681 [Prunus dulcis]
MKNGYQALSHQSFLYCDNNGAIATSQGTKVSSKIQAHSEALSLSQGYVADGDISVLKVASADNVADPLTKPISQLQLDRHMEKMGIRYMSDCL